MRRWIWALIIPSLLWIGDAMAEPPKSAATSTTATGLSAEDLELAQYLMLLENLELLEDLDMLELWPVLEEEDE